MIKLNYTGQQLTGFSFPVKTEINRTIGTIDPRVWPYSIYHSVVYKSVNYR